MGHEFEVMIPERASETQGRKVVSAIRFWQAASFPGMAASLVECQTCFTYLEPPVERDWEVCAIFDFGGHQRNLSTEPAILPNSLPAEMQYRSMPQQG